MKITKKKPASCRERLKVLRLFKQTISQLSRTTKVLAEKKNTAATLDSLLRSMHQVGDFHAVINNATKVILEIFDEATRKDSELEDRLEQYFNELSILSRRRKEDQYEFQMDTQG